MFTFPVGFFNDPGGTAIYSVNSADLDGTSQYFTCSDILNTSLDWSVYGWVKFDSFSDNNTLISDFDTTSGLMLRYRNISGNLRLTVDDGAINFDSTFGALSAGVWYFIGASYNTVSGYTITVNGTTDTLATTSANNVARGFNIGALRPATLSQNIEGSIGVLAVYDKTLTSSERTELYNSGVSKCYNDLSTALTTDLVAFWNLGNTSGGELPSGQELTDQSGNGNNLTNVGSTPFTGSGLSVECSTFAVNSANLNGSSQYFDAGNPTVLQITGNQSIAIRYKFDVVPSSSECIASRYDNQPTGRSWQLVYTSFTNQIRFDAFDDGTSTVASQVFASTPVAGQWYSLVVVYNGTDMRLYIDGSLVDTDVYSGGFFNGGADVFIGSRARTDTPPDLHMDGSVSHFKIWNSDLSSSQVTELYNGGTPKCYSSLSSGLKTNLVYAPDLSNDGVTSGNELVDNSPSAITTANVGSTPFTGSGLNVEC